ncbi:MAG: response regulator transcription factor [Cyanobacteria bacterium P01_A01_bin.40]
MIYGQLDKLKKRQVSLQIALLLADRDRYFTKEVETLLNFYQIQNDYQVRIINHSANQQHQLLDLVAKQRPSLVLVDLELNHNYLAGLEIVTRLKQVSHASKILVLSAHKEDEIIFQAMQAGAWGYVCKDNLVEQLIMAITTVLDGQVYLSPCEATRFFHTFRKLKLRLGGAYALQSQFNLAQIELTEREQEVLLLLVEGASNRKISEQLYITVATVKAHLTSIFEKFDVNSRTQAIVKAFRLGLV